MVEWEHQERTGQFLAVWSGGKTIPIGTTPIGGALSRQLGASATLVQLSLSCDHRAIDGAVGARFMAELRRLIEQPELLVAA